jgi:hypothetical protein
MDTCENCGKEYKLPALRYTTVPPEWTPAHRAEGHVDGRAYLCGPCRQLVKAGR